MPLALAETNEGPQEVPQEVPAANPEGRRVLEMLKGADQDYAELMRSLAEFGAANGAMAAVAEAPEAAPAAAQAAAPAAAPLDLQESQSAKERA